MGIESTTSAVLLGNKLVMHPKVYSLVKALADSCSHYDSFDEEKWTSELPSILGEDLAASVIAAAKEALILLTVNRFMPEPK